MIRALADLEVNAVLILVQKVTHTLHQIIFKNWFKYDKYNECTVAVDGVDMTISECGRDCYSHKLKKSAVRYEIVVSFSEKILFGSMGLAAQTIK